MPDCSAVTITAYPPEGIDLDALADELAEVTNDDGWDWHPDPGDVEVEAMRGYVEWSDYDCPWGTNTPEEAGVFATLRERNIAYEAVDYGHFTWDGSTEVWKPGMDKPMLIDSGTEGSYMIPVQQIYSLVLKLSRQGIHGLSDDAAFRAGVFAMIPPELP